MALLAPIELCEPDSQTMKILVIEDDREAADYLEKALGEAGHTTHVARDGEAGFSLADSENYDVLIVDRMLPRRDGLSVIAGLRARGNDTPVLILSALGRSRRPRHGPARRRRRLSDQALCLHGIAGAYRSAEPPRVRLAMAKRSIVSAISSSTACPIRSSAPARRSCCSRANSVCSNI
jgi:CheY-like chemotaxis protein